MKWMSADTYYERDVKCRALKAAKKAHNLPNQA
jgi:hypothetical protein